MLILTAQDVHYCQLIEEKSDSVKIYPGISYRNFLFVRGAIFEKNQLEKAIAKCRQFLEGVEPITAIIVKDKEQITVGVKPKKLV